MCVVIASLTVASSFGNHFIPTGHMVAEDTKNTLYKEIAEAIPKAKSASLDELKKNAVWFGECTNPKVVDEDFRKGGLVSIYVQTSNGKKKVRISSRDWDAKQMASLRGGRTEPTAYTQSDLKSFQFMSEPFAYQKDMEKEVATQTFDTDVIEVERDGGKVLQWKTRMKAHKKDWEDLFIHEVFIANENGKSTLYYSQMDRDGNPFWTCKLQTAREVN
jgi:hypothetical protein